MGSTYLGERMFFFGTAQVPEIRIALFGQRHSGKSTFLASYYGHQQTHAFNKKHGYGLRADAGVGNALLSRFYAMQEGAFPNPTTAFAEYKFDLLVSEVPKPSLRVTWYDYPGEWWTESPKTDEESRVRKDALAKLLSSHIGILLLDGDKYRRDSKGYVCSTLSQFRQEILRLRDECSAAGRPMTEFPEFWIIALSKADLLPDSVSARDVAKEILAHSLIPLQDVSQAIDSQSFGNQFLLLSSAKGDGGRVVDPRQYVGLQLVAPLALAPALSVEAQRRQRGGVLEPTADWLMRLGPTARHYLAQVAIRLPGSWKVIAPMLLALLSDENIKASADKLRQMASDEVKKGKFIEAAATLLFAEMQTPEADRAFHQTQKDLTS